MSNSNINQIVTNLATQLPYNFKNQVIVHINTLVSNINSLVPGVGVYNDLKLIKLQGTIPIYFQKQRYNIPILIILPLNYPQVQPEVFVVEINNIALRKNHRYVDSKGKCYAPYLSEWKIQTHNLYDLCNYLAAIFGEDPPVCAAPQNSNQLNQSIPIQNSNSTSYPQQNLSYPQQNLSYQQSNIIPVNPPNSQFRNQPLQPNYSNNIGYPSQYNTFNQNIPQNIPQNYSQNFLQNSIPQYNGYNQGNIVNQKDQLQELKSRVFSKIKTKAQENNDSFYKAVTDQDEIKRKSNIQETEANRLSEATKNYDIMIQNLKEQIETFESFIQKNENSELNVEELVSFKGPIQQKIEVEAEDYAIEDLLYHLDYELNNGNISTEKYLKTVRQLARSQFQARIIREKIQNTYLQ